MNKNMYWRALLAQVLATTAKNLLLFNIGMVHAFIKILIADVHQAEKGLSLDSSEISWLAGLLHFCNPVGALFSGCLLTWLGCKYSMMLLTVPSAAAWLAFYWAQSPSVLLVTAVVMGLVFGLAEAPTKTYSGEICEPSLRGALLTYSCTFFNLGLMVPAALELAVPWRMVAALCTTVPLLTLVSIAAVPESPIRLVDKGCISAANNSLCWLRGWTSPCAIEEELEELVSYCKNSKKRRSYGRSLVDNLRSLLFRDTLEPLVLVLTVMFIALTTVNSFIHGYLIQVFQELNLPLGANWTLVLDSLACLLSSLATTCLIPHLGRRPMVLFSIIFKMFTQFLLGCYVRWHWGTPVFAQVLVLLSTVSGYLGLFQVPWLLISEVFPFRSRGIASGISGAFGHVVVFALVKFYVPLKEAVGLEGIYWICAFTGPFGFAYLYWYLPETEGKSLGDIEKLFDVEDRSELAIAEDVLLATPDALPLPTSDCRLPENLSWRYCWFKRRSIQTLEIPDKSKDY